MYTNSQITILIEEHIHSERDRGIMKRRLVDGIRFEPLAEEYGLSVRQTKNIVKQHQTELFRHIPENCMNAD